MLSSLIVSAAALFAAGEPCPSGCNCAKSTIDCVGLNLTAPPLPSAESSTLRLHLDGNAIAAVDLSSLLRHYPSLRSLSLSANGLSALLPPDGANLGAGISFSLTRLDLSRNHLHVLHARALSATALPALTWLNLSGNALHTLAPAALASLPALTTLDLSNNRLEEAHAHFFESSPRLSEIDLSRNRLSRLNDGTLGHLTQLSLVDLSHNQIMRVEDNVFTGINVSHLDLGFNALRRPPAAALRRLAAARTLVLDGNPFERLERDALQGVPAEFVSISHCPRLALVAEAAVEEAPTLETLTINYNPMLSYFHPQAVTGAPRLAALDLSNNALFALEESLPRALPGLKALYLEGNRLACHCSLAWVASLGQDEEDQLQLADRSSTVCLDSASNSVPISQVASFPRRCEPYILPLFAPALAAPLGDDATWLCKALGSPRMAVTWRLPHHASIVGDGECLSRACVAGGGVLTVKYLHPEDAGRYTCMAENAYGKDQRDVTLEVTSENIQIFPITVASTFVTLSWNTSSTLSTGRGYILQVRPQAAPSDLRQYEDIDVGLKMNSYTVSGLSPGQAYLFTLCLRKANYVLAISSAELTTRNSEFQRALGIQTDYVTVAAVAGVLSLLAAACVGAAVARIWRYAAYRRSGAAAKRRHCGRGKRRCDEEMIITSPSDHSSSAVAASVSASTSSQQVVVTCDAARLMEHEVTSPIEEETRAMNETALA